ncbi:MAG TPA: nucleoside hydrolase [Devosiaceae bacterium]|nr:nucleoside hydrolase [Devosiaceae bacterium]
MPKLKAIFDTDPGIDDAMALLLLARHPDIELLGITTVFGNADIETVTRNALFLKDRFGLEAPVAQGAAAPLDAPRVPRTPAAIHGENGLGDIPLPETIAATLDPRPGHRLIIDLIRQHPHEITLIPVGRMTNLALALREAPDIAGLVKSVVIMGGAFGRNGHTGNVSPVAEANIIGDPVAADIAFGANWPVTLVGLDVTKEVLMTPAYVEELAANGGEDGRFVRDVSRHYETFYGERDGIEGFYVHDASAVTYALHPEFFATERGQIRVVPEGLARGQTIIKPESSRFPPGAWDDRPVQTICVGVQSGRVLKLYRDIVGG